MILALKTADNMTHLTVMDPQGKILAEKNWESGRQLAEELLGRIITLLVSQSAGLADLTGLIVFQGPGSFTSLRIGIASVNALAYALAIPNVGAKGENWADEGAKLLSSKTRPQIVTPIYDRGPNVTSPRR